MGTRPAAAPALVFPDDFTVGVATAAYQIEGGARDDGRGPSIWDTFSHTPGRIRDGSTGDVAIDHYHRLESDLDDLARLGVDAYRFSVSWSRVLPTGAGRANRAGLDFYERLVDGLLARGIRPALTLYHWDLPQALEYEGGWTSRETAFRFGEYADLVGRALGDRVDTWMTLNEPWCAAFLGHASGVMAPGRTDPVAALRAAHHLNLAHGLGMQALRPHAHDGAQLGVALNIQVPRGVGDDAGTAEQRIDDTANQSFLGPMLRGAYPAGLRERTTELTDWSFVRDGDLDQIRQPLDFLGVNYYSTLRVRLWDGVTERSTADGHMPGASPWVGAEDVEFLPQDPPYTAMGWNIAPEALAGILRGLSAEFPDLPLAVTENGAAFDDVVRPDGTVDDADRIDHIGAHLTAIHDCLRDGVDVRGFYLWTWIDNFEWGHGFVPKFGIMRVEDGSLARIAKRSFDWYSAFARTKRLHGDVGGVADERGVA
ncbi:GH1 family beta-glucosidase [Agromyces sp. SYSU T00194]|uniref:GH1 family beta-glucosidase n=1 Tax=Agromyces chitinivorans TaxID=3158560 RepID=UPI00339136D5